ncbi:MAG: DUF4293 domain-containing protein [Muribaculaceae bacterium]|nr:DUF4293 domain-containing protein [Muribaculaceae bacterium]
MQIQRLQTLYLFFALILQTASIFMPWWTTSETTIGPADDPMTLILSILASALALAGICLFKNLRRQKLAAGLCALMGLLSVSYALALTYLTPDSEVVSIATGTIPMAIGAIFAIMARNRVIHDEKLLRSADRLR